MLFGLHARSYQKVGSENIKFWEICHVAKPSKYNIPITMKYSFRTWAINVLGQFRQPKNDTTANKYIFTLVEYFARWT